MHEQLKKKYPTLQYKLPQILTSCLFTTGINDLMAVADLEEDTCLDNVDYKYVKRLSELDQQGSTGFPC